MASQPKIMGRPDSWDEMFPGRFLHACDLKGRWVTLTIADAHMEDMATDDDARKGKKEPKAVLTFKDGKGRTLEKQLAVNVTNKICIVKMFGKGRAACIGKRITIAAVAARFKMLPDVTEAIRVMGSPDIDEDINFKLVLPRKKGVQTRLHKVTRELLDRMNGPQSARPAATEQPTVPDAAQAAADLRACADTDALEQLRERIWAAYEAAGAEVPDEVLSACAQTRESLAEPEAVMGEDL
jgi:hypothetical protein